MKTSRRDFLRYASLVTATSFAAPGILFSHSKTDPHAALCKQKFDFAASERLLEKTMSEVMVALGMSFLQAPYKAHTLETPGNERLIVNLKEFDCVTFVETTLALARCVKLRKSTFNEFRNQLQLIRYRDGAINGYPSRLHYFSDWMDDNEKKNTVKNVTKELGGIPFEKTINFMSAHPQSYKQLNNPAFLNDIKGKETELSLRRHFYIPKERIQSVREQIHDGDIIGITTSIGGLDIIHTGLACRFQGYLRFLHAPLSGGAIQITKRTIVDHLASFENHTGIMIARPLNPET